MTCAWRRVPPEHSSYSVQYETSCRVRPMFGAETVEYDGVEDAGLRLRSCDGCTELTIIFCPLCGQRVSVVQP